MKKSLKLFVLILIMGIAYVSPRQASASPAFGVNFQVFYNELSPFGDWVLDPAHGYVWIPYVDGHFHPYGSHGRWVMTSFGNTWVSDFAWGWAPFHYGRWFWSDFYGWAWVPGYEWGPAWVSWRSGGGFYGWAPLAPGIHVNVSFGMPSNYWVFIPQRRFRHRHFNRYYVSHHHVTQVFHQTTIINNTTVINNNTFYTGPSRREIERVTNSRIPVYQVQDSNRPGRTMVRNNSVEVYRPQIQTARNDRDVVRPSRAYSQEEFRSRNATRSAQPQGRTATSINQSSNSNENTRTGQMSSPQNPSRATAPNGASRNNTVTRSSSENINQPRVSSSGTERQGTIRREEIRTDAPVNRNSAPAMRNTTPNSNTGRPAVRNAPSQPSNSTQPSGVTRNQSTGPRTSAPAPTRSESVRTPASNTREYGQGNSSRATPSRSANEVRPSATPSRSNSSTSSEETSTRTTNNSGRNRNNN